MKSIILRLLFVFALVGSLATLHAEDVNAVKARMAQRVSQIDQMKARGVVGENNRGMLEVREGQGAADTDVIAAENKDREAAYEYLAKQTSTSVDQVARARARQIVQGSVPGVWVQEINGNWKKK